MSSSPVMNASTTARSRPCAITAIAARSGCAAASFALLITGTSFGPSTAAQKVNPGNPVRTGSAYQTAASASGQTHNTVTGQRSISHSAAAYRGSCRRLPSAFSC